MGIENRRCESRRCVFSHSRVDREQCMGIENRRCESRRCGFFRQKILFKDKLSSKNLSPEIAVNYCKTVQVSVNHG